MCTALGLLSYAGTVPSHRPPTLPRPPHSRGKTPPLPPPRSLPRTRQGRPAGGGLPVRHRGGPHPVHSRRPIPLGRALRHQPYLPDRRSARPRDRVGHGTGPGAPPPRPVSRAQGGTLPHPRLPPQRDSAPSHLPQTPEDRASPRLLRRERPAVDRHLLHQALHDHLLPGPRHRRHHRRAGQGDRTRGGRGPGDLSLLVHLERDPILARTVARHRTQPEGILLEGRKAHPQRTRTLPLLRLRGGSGDTGGRLRHRRREHLQAPRDPRDHLPRDLGEPLSGRRNAGGEDPGPGPHRDRGRILRRHRLSRTQGLPLPGPPFEFLIDRPPTNP